MRIIFDQGTPAPLRRHLRPHEVDTVAERNWSTLTNGELLRMAKEDGYDVLVTTDQNLRYQQNIEEWQIGVVVLMSTSWPRIQHRVAEVAEAVSSVASSGYVEVAID
jgi:hypothetical protein